MKVVLQLCAWLLVSHVAEGRVETQDTTDIQEKREDRSLADTFPFSLDLRNDVDLGRESKQGDEPDVKFDAVAAAGVQEKRCVQKVVMEEQLVWENVETCDHSYNKRCHKSEITIYSSAQEEECSENFVKKCFIEYSKAAANVTVDVCRTPLVKDCDKEGEEICSTQYESECTTSQEKHEVEDDVPECKTEQEEKCEENTSGYTSSTACTKWPKEVCSLSKAKKTKFSPITKCVKIPVELCGPAGCGFKEGVESCIQKTQTVVSDQPKETCTLDPQRNCKHVTKLVPALKEVERCVDVPKEVCVRSQRNPRKVAKPVIKNWCYKVKCPDECRLAAQEGKCLPACEEFKGDPSCCAVARKATPPPTSRTTTKRTTTKRTTTKRTTTKKTTTKRTTTKRTTTKRTTTKRTTTKRTSTPKCEKICMTEAAKGKCPRQCEKYKGDQDCCGECSRKCKEAAKEGKCLPECQTYKGDISCCNPIQFPTTTLPPASCPRECKQAARSNQCLPECKIYQGDPKCCNEGYLPPTTTKRTTTKRTTTKRTTTKPTTTKPTTSKRTTTKRTTTKADKAEKKPQKVTTTKSPERTAPTTTTAKTTTAPPCPSDCLQSAAEGKCLPKCEQFNSPKCCSKCPAKCVQAALIGHCPSDCKQFEGDANCCAPKCPPKCTSTRKGTCSATGVPECSNIPGCCPELFDELYGYVSFEGQGKDDE